MGALFLFQQSTGELMQIRFVILAGAVALSMITNSAKADTTTECNSAVNLILDQKDREYVNTGKMVLCDPETKEVLGKYEFVTGGYGRGSSPFGTYYLGNFRGTDDDPNGIGKRWMLSNIGPEPEHVEDGLVKDPGNSVNPKPHMRKEIELHRARSKGTAGCFGVVASKDAWSQFVDQMNVIRSKVGQVVFSLVGNPSGAETAVAGYAPLRRPYHAKSYHGRHKEYHHASRHRSQGSHHYRGRRHR